MSSAISEDVLYLAKAVDRMTLERDLLTDPRIQAAIAELRGLILGRYPEATFDVGMGEDPAGVYLRPVVDVEDRSAVVDVLIDWLVELQVEEGLPLYVVPGRPSATPRSYRPGIAAQ